MAEDRTRCLIADMCHDSRSFGCNHVRILRLDARRHTFGSSYPLCFLVLRAGHVIEPLSLGYSREFLSSETEPKHRSMTVVRFPHFDSLHLLDGIACTCRSSSLACVSWVSLP